MKKLLFISILCIACISSAVALVACRNDCKEIELMGAGDRIHDSYTFANRGVVLTEQENDKYKISGSVDYLSDIEVKKEFNISQDINHVIAIKLSNCSNIKTEPKEVEIKINGNTNYDSQHLNGSNYTFIILEARVDSTTTISVKWNSGAQPKVYTIYMSQDLQLLEKDS